MSNPSLDIIARDQQVIDHQTNALCASKSALARVLGCVGELVRHGDIPAIHVEQVKEILADAEKALATPLFPAREG